MRKKLPPYGLSVTPSAEPIWLFAGEFNQIFTHLKHRRPNTIGIYLWNDPDYYTWPVKGRDVIIFCWFDLDDKYYLDLVSALLASGARNIYLRHHFFDKQKNYIRK